MIPFLNKLLGKPELCKNKRANAALKHLHESKFNKSVFTRIHEGRLLMALIEDEAPEFLKNNFHVLDILKNNDEYLVGLAKLVDLNHISDETLVKRIKNNEYPMPWPKASN